MTNLTIQQSTSSVENVSAQLIDKLYKLALTSKVEDSSNALTMSLQGNISATAAYEDAIIYLRAKFPNLTINVPETGYYARFADPVFGQACVNKYSTDGIGVTKAQLAAVSSPSDLITSNSVWTSSLGDKTAVASLEDFKYFSGILNSDSNVVDGFTNATKIVFPSATFYYSNRYNLQLVRNCLNLQDIDYQNAIFSSTTNGTMYVIYYNNVITEWNSSLIPNQTDFNNVVLFQGWTKLKKVIFPEGVTVTADSYRSCVSMQYIEYPTTITDMGSSWDFGRDSGHNIPVMVIKAVTPPDWYGYNPNNTSQSGRGFGYDLFPIAIYVPDNSVTAYKSFVNGGTNNEQAWASDYIKERIKPLSELPQIYREMGTVTQADIDRV